jgi:hypothetical protein
MDRCGAKVVVRYADGRFTKGKTYDFQVGRPRFHVFAEPRASDALPVRVDMSDLKAVFFVRDLAGRAQHTDRGEFPKDRPTGPRSGFRVAVTFRDGEVLIGTTENPPSASRGLLVVPADPQSNDLRVYVVPTAVRSVRIVDDVRPVRQGSLGRRQGALVPEPKGQMLPAAVHSWLASPVPA